MNNNLFPGKAPVIAMLWLFAVSGCGSVAELKDVLGLEDKEKPKAEISRDGDLLIAKLIPRGKNTSVLISFEAPAGQLINLKGVDFDTASHPLVDAKDFRSALFELKLGQLTPGQEVEITVGSEFFTTATEYWIYNRNNHPPWVNATVGSVPKDQIYVDLKLRAKDGGPLDSDGMENGEVTLVGGPLDSFWGYALGTLFIRFFGVFIVLIALMFFMIFFGKIATRLKSRKKDQPAAGHMPLAKPNQPKSDDDQQIDPKLFAAIALAIELETRSTHPSSIISTKPMDPESRLWAQQGRAQLMNERSSVYMRVKS